MTRLAQPLRLRTRRSSRTAEKDRTVRVVLACGLMSMVILIAGCAREAAPAASPAQSLPFLLQASIKELMDAQVDPSADVIWESVYTRVSDAGREDHQLHTLEEWQAVRRSALTLIESTNL